MASPTLLYTTDNIQAFYLQNGEQQELTPSGPQTLSLVMVPTETPEGEQDFYLHLYLPPELDLALPATTQIFPQGSNGYLIPHNDSSFIRVQFPATTSTDDIDTFESILAQCTAFHETTRLPRLPPRDADHSYNQQLASEKKSTSTTTTTTGDGKIVLVDEDNGSVLGELSTGYDVVKKPGVTPGEKSELDHIPLYYTKEERTDRLYILDPVEIHLPTEGQGNQVSVSNVSDEDYLAMARDPRYRKSRVVQSSAEVSRLLVTGSTHLSNLLASGAENFTQKTKPNPKPLAFSDATQARIRKASNFSHDAARFSARTTGRVSGVAQNFGASLAGHHHHHDARDGVGGDDGGGGGGRHQKKPGILNSSLIAFSTLADGVERGAKNVLESGSSAATTMLSHRYGNEAGTVAHDFTSGFKNVGLVYIDATGVSRKAFVKSVAKGMIVGRTSDGRQVMVGDTGDDPRRPAEAALTRGRTPPPPYEDGKK